MDDGWMDRWMDGWMDDGWMMDGWIDEWINSMGSIHTVEYYRTMKRREDLTQAATGMDPDTRCSVREADTEGRSV